MRYKKIIVALLLCALLTACSNIEQPGEGAPQNVRTVRGGVPMAADNINLKDIGISQESEQTVVTLSLLSGSRKTGYAESKLTQLPEYTVTLLDQPQRIKIELSSISFWDYEQKNTWALSDFVVGLFREVPADDDSLVIYLQLTKDAEFSVDELEGNLVVRISQTEENEGIKYFCAANAFFEHQEGRWPKDIDMEPVLGSDLNSRLLISKPFDSREEAEDYAVTVAPLLKTALPEKQLSVIELSGGALPDYSADIDYSLLEGRQIVVKPDGSEAKTTLLLQNGKYLAAFSDGRIAFSRRYKPEEPALEQDSYTLSDRLWIYFPNGRIQSIDVPEFFSIDSASFSADGRYIGLIDVSIENRVLYVYDFVSGTLYNLGEEGFGSQTTSFTWADTGNTLYAMTGYGNMQMMSCGFLTDGSLRIGAVEEQAGGEGSIAVSRGRLYFADGTQGYVYQIGGEREKITTGMNMRMSPDGKTLLVLETVSGGGEQVLTLKLFDIETGRETPIIDRAEIDGFDFSSSSNKVYYMAASEAGDEFDYALYVYDIPSGTSTKALLSRTAWFAPAPQPATVYLIDYIDDGSGNSFYATYVYDLTT